jgi:hypothetical protein
MGGVDLWCASKPADQHDWELRPYRIHARIGTMPSKSQT